MENRNIKWHEYFMQSYKLYSTFVMVLVCISGILILFILLSLENDSGYSSKSTEVLILLIALLALPYALSYCKCLIVFLSEPKTYSRINVLIRNIEVISNDRLKIVTEGEDQRSYTLDIHLSSKKKKILNNYSNGSLLPLWIIGSNIFYLEIDSSL